MTTHSTVIIAARVSLSFVFLVFAVPLTLNAKRCLLGGRRGTTDKSVIGVVGLGRLFLHWFTQLTPTKMQSNWWEGPQNGLLCKSLFLPFPLRMQKVPKRPVHGDC